MSSLHLDVLKMYRTPNNWAFVPVHYSHDPEKDDAWYVKERAIYHNQEDWDREQEIDFSLHLGTATYSNFRKSVHVVDALPILPHLPLDICMDFNVSPMVWEVSQTVNGWLHFNEELYLDPATTEKMVDEFRQGHPAHPAGLTIYGDATGHGRSAQTAQSNYDLARIAFRGYPTPIQWKVPDGNPDERDRVNAFQLKLKPPDGMPGILICGPKCPELIADMQGVVYRPDQKKILKIYSGKDPYSKRTHSSDAAGYKVWYEWPVLAMASRMNRKPKTAVLKPGKLIGDIDWGRGRDKKR